jgi:PST family polysaccharide transporter
MRGIAFTASRGVLTALLRVATIAVLARLLTPADFGLVATAVLFQALTCMLFARGLGDALIQRSDLTATDAGTALSLMAGVGILFCAGFWLGAPWIETLVTLDGLAPALQVIGLSIPIEAVAQFYRSEVSRRLQFERIALVDAIAAIAGNSALPIALAYLGFGYWALIAGVIAQAAMQAIGLGLGTWRRYPPKFAFASVRKLFAFSALITCWTLVGYCFQNIERLVLARFVGADAVGYFSRARTFIMMFVEFYGMPVNQVLFPVLAKLQDERQRLFWAYRQASAFSALLSLPSALVVVAAAQPLVEILLGPQWDAAIPLVRILGINIFFMIIAMPFVAIVRGIGELKEPVLMTAAQAIAMAIGAAVLHPYGLEAIAWWATALYALGFFGCNWILNRKLKLGYWDLYRPLRPALIYSGLVAGVWLALEGLSPLSTDTVTGAGVFVAIIGLAFAVLVLVTPTWFLGEDLLWLRELWGRLRSRLPGAGKAEPESQAKPAE